MTRPAATAHAPTVLITGMGVISAAGANLPATLDAFAAQRRNAGKVTLFATPLDFPVFAVRDFPGDTVPSRGSRTLGLALHAVAEALAEAKLGATVTGLRVGVCLGTTVACQLNDVDFYTAYRKTGAAPMEPVTRFLKGNLADAVACAVQASGPRATVVNACSSGSDAIGVALSWLQGGLCDLAIAGGADELNRIPLCGFGALSVVSSSLCAPYDRDRAGLNLGEGAGVLVLETTASAQRRGVTSRLRLAGYGAACDAYHLTAPRPDGSGLEAAVRYSLRAAGIVPDEVDFVNAHGTATRDNDKVEGAVLARVFGPGIRVLSTKGFTGYTLGAAGGLEAAFTAAGLREGWIPASAGFVNRDEEIPLGAVSARTPVTGRYAVSTSLAFGGNNASLVMGLTK